MRGSPFFLTTLIRTCEMTVCTVSTYELIRNVTNAETLTRQEETYAVVNSRNIAETFSSCSKRWMETVNYARMQHLHRPCPDFGPSSSCLEKWHWAQWARLSVTTSPPFTADCRGARPTPIKTRMRSTFISSLFDANKLQIILDTVCISFLVLRSLNCQW